MSRDWWKAPSGGRFLFPGSRCGVAPFSTKLALPPIPRLNKTGTSHSFSSPESSDYIRSLKCAIRGRWSFFLTPADREQNFCRLFHTYLSSKTSSGAPCLWSATRLPKGRTDASTRDYRLSLLHWIIALPVASDSAISLFFWPFRRHISNS